MRAKKWWSCKYDRVFKFIVVDENDHTIMEAILNSIFEEPVKIIRYHNTEMKVNSVYEKVRIADVLIELHGEYIHIEVETGTSLSSRIKNFSTFTTFFNQHVVRGDAYDANTKFLHITLQYGMGDGPLKSYNYIMNPKTNELLIHNIEILCINMDKLKKMWDNEIEEVSNYKYLVMLNLEREELEKFRESDAIVEKYKEKIIKLNDSPKFQAMMSYEERQALVHNTDKKLAYEEGVVSGITQGITQGHKEKQMEIAKKMMNLNIPIEQISLATELTMEEIENLK